MFLGNASAAPRFLIRRRSRPGDHPHHESLGHQSARAWLNPRDARRCGRATNMFEAGLQVQMTQWTWAALFPRAPQRHPVPITSRAIICPAGGVRQSKRDSIPSLSQNFFHHRGQEQGLAGYRTYPSTPRHVSCIGSLRQADHSDGTHGAMPAGGEPRAGTLVVFSLANPAATATLWRICILHSLGEAC